MNTMNMGKIWTLRMKNPECKCLRNQAGMASVFTRCHSGLFLRTCAAARGAPKRAVAKGLRVQGI
jgi:hypothetical protein